MEPKRTKIKAKEYNNVSNNDECECEFQDEENGVEGDLEGASPTMSNPLQLQFGAYGWSRFNFMTRALLLALFLFFAFSIAALLLIRSPLSPSTSASSSSNNFHTNSSSPTIMIASESPPKPYTDSPFFEYVLEWQEIPLADNHEDEQFNSNSHTIPTRTKGNHYRAFLEFCSDPKTGLFGYGIVGKCVPGGPSPLIRMKPKVFYHLTLFNNAHIDTNLHTHGLHISGVGTFDDITRVAKPGECLTYDHYILDDADVGTFFYHPHRHPLVAQSVYGGAYGMLIVDESKTFVKNENNQEDSSLQQRDQQQLHLGFYPRHLQNFLKRNEILLQFSSMYDEKLQNPVRTNKVNGHDTLELILTPNAYYYFRVSSVVYADSFNYIEFEPRDACDVRVVAYDGVYRSEIPSPDSHHRFMMTVSSRTDFSVLCTKNANIHFHQGGDENSMTNHTKLVTIRTMETDSSTATTTLESSNTTAETSVDTNDSRTPATLVISLPATLPSSPYWNQTTQSSWKPRRPYYMPDLSIVPDYLVDEFWDVTMDDDFLKWDPGQSIHSFALGQLVEESVVLSEKHPYHAHINRLQIVEPGGCGERFEEGEYFDTLVQQQEMNKPCRVRRKFFDFAGRVIIHCHRFDHEDNGMMTWIDVLGGDGHGMSPGPASICTTMS